MSTRYFALIYGIIFLVVGLLGFVPSLLTPIIDGPNLAIESGYGRLFDLFPVNLLHNLIHLAIGVFGIFAYKRYDSARGYARSMAVVYGVLTLMGLLPLQIQPSVWCQFLGTMFGFT